MTARARSAARTRADILAAARDQFARTGYDRTTTRSVAAAVGVDAALVNRYFGSKAELFAEAARQEVDFPDLVGLGPDETVRTLVDFFFDLYEGPGGMLALVRCATTNPVAAAQLRDVFVEKAAPGLAKVAVDRPAQRAALVGAQFAGLAFSRYVLLVPSVAGMSRADVRHWLGPILLYLLTDPAAGTAAAIKSSGDD